MNRMSRREFLQKSGGSAAALCFASSGVRSLYANPLGLPIGSQTYPHRQRVKDGDFAGLCKDLAELGVGIVELCSPAYADFARLTDGKQTRRIIEDYGLMCPSGHFQLNELRTKQEQAIAWAKDIGMIQMGTATLAGRTQNRTTTMDVVKRAADEYNRIGEAASKAGIVQFLHDEAFEMASVDGRLVYEVLFELLDPKFVKFQFQASAMRTVGDPVIYFNKYPGRIISMHLQGINMNPPIATPARQAAAGGQVGAAGQRRRRGGPQLPVGKDSVDWPRVFAAARTGGVKNYFVEQNWDATVQSVAYLKTLN